MKTLLIYMADGMTSHEVSIHHHRTIGDDSSMDDHFTPKMGTYRDHFKGKHVAKLVMTILNVNDETGATTVIHEEQHIHPLKPKIVINKPAGVTQRVVPKPSGFWATPPSALTSFAAQQATISAQAAADAAQFDHMIAAAGTLGNV